MTTPTVTIKSMITTVTAEMAGMEVRESSGGAPTLLRFSWLLFAPVSVSNKKNQCDMSQNEQM